MPYYRRLLFLEAAAMQQDMPRCAPRVHILSAAAARELQEGLSAARYPTPSLHLGAIKHSTRPLLLPPLSHRHDLFNVRLRLACFLDDDVRYSLFGLGGAGEAITITPLKSTVPYRGPALRALTNGLPDAPGRRCAVLLEVPGLLEGRPVLVMGDSVHVRVAVNPAVGFQATVLATSASTAFLWMPDGFWGNKRMAPLLLAMGELAPSAKKTTKLKTTKPADPFDGRVLVRFG